MKHILLFMLIGMFMLSMGACSKKDTADTGATTDPTANVDDTPPPVEDATDDQNSATDTDVQSKPVPVLQDVFFDFDKFALTSTAKRQLEGNAVQLRDADSYNITIEGHCDERGTVAYNFALGENRAKATRDYLVSLGVPASNITVVSYGEERPFDSGHDEAAWSKNRRGHFVLDN